MGDYKEENSFKPYKSAKCDLSFVVFFIMVLPKIRRYYHKTWPFFMEILLTNELTIFKQKCYIHGGRAKGLSMLF